VCPGGATSFIDEKNWDESSAETKDCVPKTGSAIVFQHDILHAGAELKKGRKYCLRTGEQGASWLTLGTCDHSRGVVLRALAWSLRRC
jgi:hypothetical protein